VVRGQKRSKQWRDEVEAKREGRRTLTGRDEKEKREIDF
jgi:hypothetical protein